jgi:hypothetical protein
MRIESPVVNLVSAIILTAICAWFLSLNFVTSVSSIGFPDNLFCLLLLTTIPFCWLLIRIIASTIRYRRIRHKCADIPKTPAPLVKLWALEFATLFLTVVLCLTDLPARMRFLRDEPEFLRYVESVSAGKPVKAGEVEYPPAPAHIAHHKFSKIIRLSDGTVLMQSNDIGALYVTGLAYSPLPEHSLNEAVSNHHHIKGSWYTRGYPLGE